jgi:hypothetical protein
MPQAAWQLHQMSPQLRVKWLLLLLLLLQLVSVECRAAGVC